MPPAPDNRRDATGGEAEPRLPGETFRGLVSVAICFYFLGFLLTVAANSGSGSSALLRTVKTRLFSPWMVPAWLDIGFDHRLSYGLPDDADHRISVQPFAGGESVRLPEPGIVGLRAARWRRLAGWLEPEAVDPDSQGLLATAIAAGLFERLDSDDLMIESQRVVMPEMAAARAAGGLDEATLERAFAARVRSVGGSVQMLPVEEQRDVAPVLPQADVPGETTR